MRFVLLRLGGELFTQPDDCSTCALPRFIGNAPAVIFSRAKALHDSCAGEHPCIVSAPPCRLGCICSVPLWIVYLGGGEAVGKHAEYAVLATQPRLPCIG